MTKSLTFHHIYRTISPKRRSLVVGNIHVLFNPNRGDIKLGQVFNAPLPPYEETKSISQIIYLSACILRAQDGVTFFYFPLGWLGGGGLFGMPVISSVKTRTIIIYTIGSLTHDILDMYLPLHDIGSNISWKSIQIITRMGQHTYYNWWGSK